MYKIFKDFVLIFENLAYYKNFTFFEIVINFYKILKII